MAFTDIVEISMTHSWEVQLADIDKAKSLFLDKVVGSPVGEPELLSVCHQIGDSALFEFSVETKNTVSKVVSDDKD